MTNFQNPLFIGQWPGHTAEQHKAFREELVALLQKPDGTPAAARKWPERVCKQQGQSPYKQGMLKGANSHLSHDAAYPEMCHGILQQLEGGKIRATVCKGGEYLIPSPDAQSFLMLWVEDPKDGKPGAIRYYAGGASVAAFHTPRDQDLLPSLQAQDFFEGQRRRAGCPESDIRAVRRDPAKFAARQAQLHLG